MKKIIIALIILVLGSGVAYYYYFMRPMPVSPSDTAKISDLTKNPLTVVYTNDGYTPKQITVKKGETVKFINMSDRMVWTASDEHPSHNIYPEFDQKSVGGKNSEYTFKFEKVGTWGFHNHAYFQHTGTVIVSE